MNALIDKIVKKQKKQACFMLPGMVTRVMHLEQENQLLRNRLANLEREVQDLRSRLISPQIWPSPWRQPDIWCATP